MKKLECRTRRKIALVNLQNQLIECRESSVTEKITRSGNYVSIDINRIEKEIKTLTSRII